MIVCLYHRQIIRVRLRRMRNACLQFCALVPFTVRRPGRASLRRLPLHLCLPVSPHRHPPPPPHAAIPPRPNYPGVRSRTNWEPLPRRRPNWNQRGSQQCRSCGNEAPAECVDHACWACCSCFNCPYHANHASSSVHAPVNSPCHPPPPPPPPPAPPYGRNRQAASGSSVSVSYVRPPLRRHTGNAVGARRWSSA